MGGLANGPPLNLVPIILMLKLTVQDIVNFNSLKLTITYVVRFEAA